MEDIENNRTERQNIFAHYLTEMLSREAWAVAHGEKSTGKTTLARVIASEYPGRALIIAPVNIKRYQREWMVVSDNQPVDNLTGSLYPAGMIYPALAALQAPSLLVIIDESQRLKGDLIPTIRWFRSLLPDVKLLTLGAFTLRQQRKLQCLHPAWLRIPLPDAQECEEIIALHAGVTPEALTELPRRLLRRMVRRCKGNLRLLARAGWGLRQVMQMEEGDVQQRGRFARWVLSGLPVCHSRTRIFCGALLLVGACTLSGWQSGVHLPPWIPEMLPAIKTANPDAPAPLTAAVMSTNNAIGLLYQVWGYEVEIKEAWCDQAWRANLACKSGRESLEALEAQGLPWIAPLEIAGKTVPLVIIGEHGDELIALTTQRTWHIKKRWFASVWDGRYTLLWKPTPEGESTIGKKSSLEEIVWLDTMLSRVLNVPAEETGEWSALLQEKIRQFQTQKALVADGIMGQLSLIRLWQTLGESPAFLHEEGE